MKHLKFFACTSLFLAPLLLAQPAFKKIDVPVIKTGCDEAGNCSFVAQIPDQPATVVGGSEDFVLRQIYSFSLPSIHHCTRARTFIGLDPGDRGEFDISLVTRSNYHILDRSFHRHTAVSFESWWPHYIDVTAQHFDMIVLGRVTASNSGVKNPNFGKLLARYHVGLKLSCTATKVAPPPPRVKPTWYIPWDDRKEWAIGLELAYSEWRGARDLAGLASRPQYLRGGDKELVPMSELDLALVIHKMTDAQVRSRRLQHRIRTEEHDEFEGRSQVRKSVANLLRGELEKWSAEYGRISEFIPLHPDCDAITCRLEKLENAQ